MEVFKEGRKEVMYKGWKIRMLLDFVVVVLEVERWVGMILILGLIKL